MTDLVTVLDYVQGAATDSSEQRHPRIAWQNLLADDAATLAVSSEQSGFPGINAIDGKEYTFWKAAIGGTQSIQVDFPSARLVNFLAVHGHNLQQVGGTVTLQQWSGTAWVTLGTSTPTTAAPLLITCSTVSGTRFRALFSSTGAVAAAVVYVGQSMVMERGCWEGMTPPWMGRVTEVTSTKSEAGVLLGRSVTLRGVEFDMDFEHLTIPFIRDFWMPFVLSAEDAPFFVQWNPYDYPGDVAFCWIEDPSKDLKRPKLTGPDHMSASVRVKGRVEGTVQ